MPFKVRKEKYPDLHGNPKEIAQTLVSRLGEIYAEKHMYVDLRTATPKDIFGSNREDWSSMIAICRSEAGTCGIFFIEFDNHEVLIIKPVQVQYNLAYAVVNTFFVK